MEQFNQGSRLPKIIATIVIVFLLGVLGFFGWHRLMQWHEKQVASAVRQEQEKQSESRRLIQPSKRLDWLEDKANRRSTEVVSDARMREVFGEPVFNENYGAETRQTSCRRLERKIRSFFAYLDKRLAAKAGTEAPEQGAFEVFEQTLDDLAEKPPLINDETRDLVSLMRNRAHFFRVLDKQRLELVLGILASEKDVLEPAMADFYDYYIAQNCCDLHARDCISEQTLYHYAGFFLGTLSGKSYLMRRRPMIRALTLYYSVLILDRAITQGRNRHGIDIRPHIELVLNDILVQDSLIFQQRYIRELNRLKEKYRLSS